MKLFNLIPPQVPIADRAGKVSPIWWRWFNNVQAATGGGGGGTIPDTTTAAFALQQPRGPDTTREVDDLRKLIATMPQTPRQPGISLQQAMAIASWGM